MRVVAVFADGPKRGWQFTVLGQSVFEVFLVPDPWIPPPLDLGPPRPWERFRRVTYWYVRSLPTGAWPGGDTCTCSMRATWT